jgi:hypothetical protein
LGAPAISPLPAEMVGAARAMRTGAASPLASEPLSLLALLLRNGAPDLSGEDASALSAPVLAGLAPFLVVLFLLVLLLLVLLLLVLLLPVPAALPAPFSVPVSVPGAFACCSSFEPVSVLDPIRAWHARGTSRASKMSTRRTAKILRLV